MIGLFAVSEVLRSAAAGAASLKITQGSIGNLFTGWGRMMVVYWRQQLRGNAIGVAIGVLPGAGADIAAWVAYAVSSPLLAHAGEVRQGARRRDHRIHVRQQCRAWGRLGPGAGLRDPGRHHHRDRDRGALREGDEPGADSLPVQSGEHLRSVHHLHPGEPADAPARLGGNKGRQAAAPRAALDSDAVHSRLLHRRRFRDQQCSVQRRQ